MSEAASDIKVYKLKDIERIMNCKRAQATKILNSGNFPIIKIGRITYVTIENFEKWLSEGQVIEMSKRRKVTPPKE